MLGKVWNALGMLGEEIQGWAYAARLGRLRTEALLRGDDPALITLEDAKGLKAVQPKALPAAEEPEEGSLTNTPDKAKPIKRKA